MLGHAILEAEAFPSGTALPEALALLRGPSSPDAGAVHLGGWTPGSCKVTQDLALGNWQLCRGVGVWASLEPLTAGSSRTMESGAGVSAAPWNLWRLLDRTSSRYPSS